MITSHAPGKTIDQTCAACGARRSLTVSDLRLTVNREGDGAIRLPPCASCNATEHLLRTTDEAPAAVHGTDFDTHRRRVNAIAEELREAGRVDGDASALAPVRDLPLPR